MKEKIKPLTGKALAREIDSINKLCGDERIKPDMKKTREILSKLDRSLSGEIVLERRGGDMWDDLTKWVKERDKAEEESFAIQYFHPVDVLNKMREIEKEYGTE